MKCNNFRLQPGGDLDLDTLTGNSIIISAYAIFGTCTKLVLAFEGQGVHEFYLDRVGATIYGMYLTLYKGIKES